MRVEKVDVQIYEAGDFVRTPDGVGKVVDEGIITRNKGFFVDYYVPVQHKGGNCRNPSNTPKNIDALLCLSIISESEYNSEN